MPSLEERSRVFRLSDKQAAQKAAEFKDFFPGTSLRQLKALAKEASTCYSFLDKRM